ncbi:MAG: AmmeMemoRadiSam system protein B [Gammaproteobacteria bacterium]|nr:AmmeMemoRadiSam system protein B [Gammaproteobacteria bacterium]
MSSIRPAAVAGLFYPDDPRQLKDMVMQMINKAQTQDFDAKAIIAPHAGYIYSGPIAASAYKAIENKRKQIKRVVLIGPSHRVAFSGIAVSSASEFATPLGNITLDSKAVAQLIQFPQVQTLDRAHEQEHSLEVHLPFLQLILDDFKLVPLVVGDTQAHEVAEVINALWDDEATFIIISSDLSHYHDYATAQRIDKQTSNAIATLNPDPIGFEQACGRNPLNGFLQVAKEKGLKAEILDQRNSGDTSGDKSRVVGYGAYVFH